MNRPELYNKTVDILVQAYFNDTLKHGNQCGCAVGNIVAANMGVKVKKDKLGRVCWNTWESVEKDAVWYNAISGHLRFNKRVFKKQIKATGYCIGEIAAIEYAFESVDWDDNADERMFSGLMSVIDALDKIHDNVDVNETCKTKAKFNKVIV